MLLSTAPEKDVLGLYARNVVRDFDKSITAQLKDQLETHVQQDKNKRRPHQEHCIGILGAGVGGLYTALILDSLGIKYEILEASNRTGGRLYTHKFQGGGHYDYYDVGAMRFPLPKKKNGVFVNGVMRRLAKLIEYPPLNTNSDPGCPPLKDRLIPYYFTPPPSSRPGILYYNGVHKRDDQPAEELDFKSEALGISNAYAQAAVTAIENDVVGPFTRLLSKDLDRGITEGEGWKVLKANDDYSMRGYMSFKYMPSVTLELLPDHLPTNVVNYSEMLNGSTASWDQGFADSVLETMAFARDGASNITEVDWRCFDGGSQQLTDYMARYLRSRHDDPIKLEKRVVALNSTSEEVIEVSVTGEPKPRRYTHVISTLPLPVYRTIDTKNVNMSVIQKTAIRQLQHDPAIKIGIRFKEPWWTTKLGIVGGQSYTDLPIRRVVYPSYGAAPKPASNVLIACYTTSNDAYRLSALAAGEKQDKEALKDLVLRNLAEVHAVNDKKAPDPHFKVTHEFLMDQFEDMHVFEWNHNPYTMSAFAMFGPGNFKQFYPAMITPAANNRLYFASEAISPRHAWVVGALDSVWRAVDTYLHCTGQYKQRVIFRLMWGNNMEWAEPSDDDPCRMPQKLPTEVPDSKGDKAQVFDDSFDEHFDLMEKAMLGGVVKF
ncbi:hypothetical protein CONPUDRAFT_156452 [Coniophora puteana RWD-64-598 SS2]|uniref:Amine oxidase domain-containing protein n=1 Tax=Coniophora puteana (strain RWD-64-598) TaxID=741705 RepID=A0A5M3MIM1_CONPW|nr:uncharacterized protein CONPUDRAFT_156452 [Coniophora puteana RWD-64-598 SS2]EIW78471.1 hypothetical protein CONPUDRAFT_156452 [Coniophora puteana RWD-64-598 SS2]